MLFDLTEANVLPKEKKDISTGTTVWDALGSTSAQTVRAKGLQN
jgi:hypothetical protein